jgi:hypothetical protein
MGELPDTALIVVAAVVGFVTGMILLFCIMIIWHYCVRIPRRSKRNQGETPQKEAYLPLDPHPSFDFVRVDESGRTTKLPVDKEPSERSFRFESGPPSPSPAATPNRPDDLCICVKEYQPKKKDDVLLEVGDQVNIFMV